MATRNKQGMGATRPPGAVEGDSRVAPAWGLRYRSFAMCRLVLISLLVTFLCWRATLAASAPSLSCEWGFSSNANPTAPEISSGITGASSAAMAPGRFSNGWISSNGILGTAQGVWDLGSSGTITLSNPSGLAGPSSQERLITISIAEYQDGGIYGQLASISVPNSTLLNSDSSTSASTPIGHWTVARSQWRAPAGAAVNAITIAGVSGGSLIDSVSLDSSFAPPSPPQLVVRKISATQIELSWPSSYSTMILQSSINPADPQSWGTVQAAIQVNGDVSSVLIDISVSGKSSEFYRLKQP